MKSRWAYLAFFALWTFGVLGGLWTARAEGMIPAAPGQAAARHAVIFSTPVPFPTLTATPRLGQIPHGVTPSATPFCAPPPGWQAIVLAAGDTLQTLAARYHTTPQVLQKANCLTGTTLLAGTQLYVPAAPTETAPPRPTARRCTPPPGWVIHIVQPGENLYRISLAYRVSVAVLQNANCLTSTLIYTGQRLWVPNVPTSTPPWTATAPPTLTFTPTITATATATSTLIPSPIASPTITETLTPTAVPQNTATPTEVPPNTATPTPTDTATPTPTPTPTAPPTPTDTATPTPTNTPTPSPTATDTPTPTPTP